ncbi:MAG: hypothetical protein K1X31_12820 [Gemmatimonadaceae bacterium]|nr:hypothetical protein [Gemmatimonadaceae bacterium]
MFRQVLYTQLKWSRLALALLSVLAFLMPAGLWRAVQGSYGRLYPALEVVSAFSMLGYALALLAFFVGFILVATGWQADATTRHVYALSLPIPWSRYVALRFGAGAVLLAVPTVALFLGSLLVLSLITIPDSLQAYPVTLAARFLLGSFVAYAGVFALQYISGKRAAHLLLVALLAFTLTLVVLELLGQEARLFAVLRALLQPPGPLAVFGAEWSLIDV